MQIRKRHFEADGSGLVVVFINAAEDLWEIYNVVRPGDVVEGTTFRKVHDDREGMIRSGRCVLRRSGALSVATITMSCECHRGVGYKHSYCKMA